MKFPRKNDYFLSSYTKEYYFFWQEWQYPDLVTQRVYSSSHDGTYSESATKSFFGQAS
ncbi:MAG: hypothetical protein WDN75_09505 [Bacteroidota bacterium]